MKRERLTFDYIFLYICDKIPLLGGTVANWYKTKSWFNRFTKFGVSTFIVYWGVRAPMMVGFTDVLGVHYVLSAFIVGIILSLIGFVISEGWIWGKK